MSLNLKILSFTLLLLNPPKIGPIHFYFRCLSVTSKTSPFCGNQHNTKIGMEYSVFLSGIPHTHYLMGSAGHDVLLWWTCWEMGVVGYRHTLWGTEGHGCSLCGLSWHTYFMWKPGGHRYFLCRKGLMLLLPQMLRDPPDLWTQVLPMKNALTLGLSV